jgi:hypothetical protein
MVLAAKAAVFGTVAAAVDHLIGRRVRWRAGRSNGSSPPFPKARCAPDVL